MTNKTVSIFMGGTGANNASDARTNLGVAPSIAYSQANNAYAAANSAANTVRVSQNSGSTLSSKQLNFVNTANVTIAITDSGDGNANIEIFSAAGGGGGSGPGSTRDSFIGNGACTTFTLSVVPENENYTIVFVGGVLQGDADYNVVAGSIQFTDAPPNNQPIEVYTIGEPNPPLSPNSNNLSIVFTTDGITNTYSLGYPVSNNNNLLLTLDGLVMIPVTDYTCSSGNLTLTFMPPSGITLEARSLR